MKRVLLVAATALGAVAFVANASAKGPSQAMIAGPGLKGPITLRGDAESNTSTRFATVVQESGFFATVFDHQTPDPTLRTRPKGDLGPRYDVIYVVPGPNNTRSRLRQELYPYAKPFPVAHMRAGQHFWDGESTYGGWIRAHQTLRSTLVALGLPAKAPSLKSSGLSAGTWAGIASGAALILATLGSILVRRRPRGREAS